MTKKQLIKIRDILVNEWQKVGRHCLLILIEFDLYFLLRSNNRPQTILKYLLLCVNILTGKCLAENMKI